MENATDRVVEVPGVGEQAAAGFSAIDGDTLQLFAARTENGMVGIRVQEAVTENDEKFGVIKSLTAIALARVK